MRMTAAHVKTKRKRQIRSARCTEKRRFRARTWAFRGLIRAVAAAGAVKDATRGEKNACNAGNIRQSSRQSACHLGNVGFGVYEKNAGEKISVHLKYNMQQ